MVGLILFLGGLWWSPASPSQGPVSRQHVERVRQLLQEPHPEELRWRKTLFQSLTRVEHGPPDVVRAGWALMASVGTDAAQSNFILYCRRQALPLPEISLVEGADSALERALALWGEGQHEACRAALEAGLATFPNDLRFYGNLHWLTMTTPQQVFPNSNSQELALAVLASRFSHP